MFAGRLDDMLRFAKEELDQLELMYPGIVKTILWFEEAKLQACPHCRSENTATVNCGVVGRTINIAGATTRFKLIPNGPKPGEYFCNACEKFFN